MCIVVVEAIKVYAGILVTPVPGKLEKRVQLRIRLRKKWLNFAVAILQLEVKSSRRTDRSEAFIEES